MLSGIAALFTLVTSAVSTAVTNIGGFLTQAANDLGLAVSGTYNQAADAAITAVGNVSSAIDAVAAAAANGVKIAYEKVDALAQQVEAWIGVTSERARQYLLARIAAAPGAIFEGLTVAMTASGPPQAPHPDQGTPWALEATTQAEVAAFKADPGHPVRAAVDATVADIQAWFHGVPTPTDPWPTTAEELVGPGAFPPIPGADPNARGLLTDTDQTYVQKTTGG